MSDREFEICGQGLLVVRRRRNAPEHTTLPTQALWDLRFRNEAGGVDGASARAFLFAHAWCDKFASVELGHYCREGPPPHDLLICILPGDNAATEYDCVLARLRR